MVAMGSSAPLAGAALEPPPPVRQARTSGSSVTPRASASGAIDLGETQAPWERRKSGSAAQKVAIGVTALVVAVAAALLFWLLG